MYRQFKFLLFTLVIQRFHSVDCYAPGSLIWSRSLQKFIPIANVSTFGAYEQEIVAKSRGGKNNFRDNVSTFGASKQVIVARSRKKEKHNFQGEVVKLAYFQDHNMVNFIDNDTKITGVCGEIWNTLAEYSNFTLVTFRLWEVAPNGVPWPDIARHHIREGHIQIIPRMGVTALNSDLLDFTTPIWESRYRMYIKPEWKSDTKWIFNIFERKVWFAILFSFLLLSALGYLTQNVSIKVSGDKERRHDLPDHLFYTIGTLCSRGSIPETLDLRSKIVDLSKKMFAGLLLLVLTSHVMSRMTNVKLQPPFEDVESLLNKTKYKIAIYDYTLAGGECGRLINNIFVNGALKRPRGNETVRVWWLRVQAWLHKAVCDHEKVALFELEDTKQAFGNRFCEMVPVGKSYLPTWITFGISKRFKFKRTFDIGILKMKEFGLIDRLKNRWLKTSAQTVHPENLGHAPFVPVNLDQVLMLFIILGIGMATSATIFVLEIIVSIYKSNQRRPVSENTFVRKAGLNVRRLPTDNYMENRMGREIELSEVSTRPIYVENIFFVDPNCSRAQENEYPRRTFYN